MFFHILSEIIIFALPLQHNKQPANNVFTYSDTLSAYILMTRLFRHRKENLIYLVFWLVLFIAPVISSYVRASGNADFSVSWQEILHIWRIYAVFLVEPAFNGIELQELSLGGRVEVMNSCRVDVQWWQGVGRCDDGVVHDNAPNITKTLRHGNHHAQKQQQYVDSSIQIFVGLHSKCKDTTK